MSRAALGIVTGSGPEAGLDLWQKLLAANRIALGDGFRGDIDAPSLIALSDPGLGLSMDLTANRDVVWRSLSRCCRKIALQVDCFAIACNTLHAFQPDIEALGLPSRFVSLVDTAVEFVSRGMLTKVALLGADPVARLDEHSPYRRLGEVVDVEVPKHSLQQLIYDIKRSGPNAELRERFRAMVQDLESRTVLLACTELPLVAQPVKGKELVDVTDLLAERMAHLALSARGRRGPPATGRAG